MNKIEAASTYLSNEPVNLEEMKNQLRLTVGQTIEDDVLKGYIRAATERVENICNIKLRKQRFFMYLDDWPAQSIRIPYMPYTSSPSTGIIYTNSNNETTTWTTAYWRKDTHNMGAFPTKPGRIVLDYGCDWPSPTLHNVNPIRVEFVAGYSATTQIPENIKLAIKLLAGEWYEHRENVVSVAPGESLQSTPNAAKALLAGYRNYHF